MNRIIKFRAWIKSGFDEDVKPFMTYEIERLHFNKGEEGIDAEDCEWDIDNIILMQFTGLKDKNGREIYDGDIVKVNYDNEEDITIHKVEWQGDYDYPAWDLTPPLDVENNGFSEIICGDCYQIEIIGNVYEDPELVK